MAKLNNGYGGLKMFVDENENERRKMLLTANKAVQ